MNSGYASYRRYICIASDINLCCGNNYVAGLRGYIDIFQSYKCRDWFGLDEGLTLFFNS